ncbi:MAG: transposase [Sedimentisphaerales bacterium]|nr:transposase [Sedimentisphaerales bacterium]
MTSKKEQFYIQRITELEKQVAELIDKVAKLSKNSSNSSKPPSSDIVKPPRKKKNNGSRNIGGQPGHTKHERPPFATEEIDEFQTHTLDRCPDCGGKLKDVENTARVVQQVEVVKKPTHIEQHTSLCYWCEHCRKFHYAPMPAHVEKGQLIGPRLTAVIAYMKGTCHCSFSTIRKFLRDVVGVTISRGQLSKLVQKASAAFEQAYNELLEYLPHKAEELTGDSFAKAMDESRKTFLDIALSNVPQSRQAQNLANRFRKHGEAYFRFITTPGIDPTNSLAEQAIRFVVIDRYITQGTRSENGRLWSERIWTVLATCTSQGRNTFDFICQSIQAHFSDQPLPSLLGP